MKRLSLMMLALAVCAFTGSTAMALDEAPEGDFSIRGTYYLDAESISDNAGSETAGYDDDLEIILRVNYGSITGVVDLEVSDDENFDGSDISRSDDIIDNYYLMWRPTEYLTAVVGEFAFTFGSAVVVYADPRAHTIGMNYDSDYANLGFYMSKMDEGARVDDTDTDAFTFLVRVKAIDLFNKLDLIIISGEDNEAGESFGYAGIDMSLTAGPVDVAIEYGQTTDDVGAYETDFVLAQVGLDELLGGFDLNIDYFSSGGDGDLAGRFGAGDYTPYMIVGSNDAGLDDDLNDMTLIGLSASYAFNEKATLMGKVLAAGEFGGDAIGNEVDVDVVYKFDDNASVQLTYAVLTPDDAYGVDDDTATDMRARFHFKF